MAIASHSTAAFRLLVRLWAGGDAVSPKPRPTKNHAGGAALACAVVARGIDARTPCGSFASVEHAARSLGVDSRTAGRWVHRFGRDLARAADAAGWDGIAGLFCNLDPDVAESEAEAWPRTADLIASAGFGLAAASIAIADPAIGRAALRVCAGDAPAAAARACGVNRPAVSKARLRLVAGAAESCTAEAACGGHAIAAAVADGWRDNGYIDAEDRFKNCLLTTENGEPAACLGRLFSLALRRAGSQVGGPALGTPIARTEAGDAREG